MGLLKGFSAVILLLIILGSLGYFLFLTGYKSLFELPEKVAKLEQRVQALEDQSSKQQALLRLKPETSRQTIVRTK